MNDKKYQVFISSTYTDLAEERKKILDVLFMADCIPAGMEAFVAADTEQFEVIKKVIDLRDYYVLIIGKRYGSVHPDTGKSYTEMEYDYCFKVIATEMMDVLINEPAIEKMIIKKLLLSDSGKYLDDSQFVKKLLNQYRALDLLKSSWSASNKVLCWGLTKKGRKVRDDMILIKKS